MANQPSTDDDRLIDITEVCELTCVHRTTIHRLIQRGAFPRGVKLGVSVRWRRRVVLDWIAAKEAAANPVSAA